MSDAKPQKLIVVMAFDRDPETGELGPTGEAMQFESEQRARREAERLSKQHAGVIAWSREAQPDIGEYGDPVELARYGDVPDLE